AVVAEPLRSGRVVATAGKEVVHEHAPAKGVIEPLRAWGERDHEIGSIVQPQPGCVYGSVTQSGTSPARSRQSGQAPASATRVARASCARVASRDDARQ